MLLTNFWLHVILMELWRLKDLGSTVAGLFEAGIEERGHRPQPQKNLIQSLRSAGPLSG